jgi:hypothetical protein
LTVHAGSPVGHGEHVAVLVKDRQTEQCFVAVTIGNSMGLSPAACVD